MRRNMTSRLISIRRGGAGFTLVEALIAFFILTLVSGGIYTILRSARIENAKTNARTAAANEANTLLKQIGMDLAAAASGSLKIDANGSFSVEHYVGSKNQRKKIRYDYQKPTLTRLHHDGTRHPVAAHLDQLLMQPKPDAPGQVVVKIVLALPIEGSSEPHKLEQTVLCVMREDATAPRDAHWRTVENINGVFNTYGDLMSTVKDDTNRIMQDIKSQVDSITQAALQAGNVGNLNLNPQEIVRQLRESIDKVKDNLINLDVQIGDMDPNGVLDIDYSWWARNISGKTDKMKDRGRAMRTALSNMKSAESMNWSQLESLAGSYRGDIRGSFRDLYNAKGDLFKAQKDLDQTMADVKAKFGL